MATRREGLSSGQDAPSKRLRSEQQHPARPSLLRVKKDIANFFADPPPGIFISPEDTDVTKVHALIIGPDGTPYEGGFFRLYLEFPAKYPMRPPTVRFLTTDAGRVRLNPHVFPTGEICLSILGTMVGPPWSPALSLSSLLISVQSLLTENPYYNEPHRVNDLAAGRYKTFVLHETIRVAVCGAVEKCLQDRTTFPSAFKDVVLKKFVEFYDKYEEVVRSHMHLSGTRMEDCYSGTNGSYKFKALLSKLQDLKRGVDQKNEASPPSLWPPETSS